MNNFEGLLPSAPRYAFNSHSKSVPMAPKPSGDGQSSSPKPVNDEDAAVCYRDDNVVGLGRRRSPQFDDLIAGLARNGGQDRRYHSNGRGSRNSTGSGQWLPGFRVASSSALRAVVHSNAGSASPHVASSSDDPFREISKLSNSGNATNKGSYNDLDPFNSLRNSMRSLSTGRNNRVKDEKPLWADRSSGASSRFSARSTDTQSRGPTSVERVRESQSTSFKMPTFSSNVHQSTSHSTSSPAHENGVINRANFQGNDLGSSDEVWLTVSEIPLFTEPTRAPPPSRPPPPRPVWPSRTGSTSSGSTNGRFPSYSSQFAGAKPVPPATRCSVASSADVVEDLVKGRSRGISSDNHVNSLSSEELDTHFDAAASAAFMKEAMERAEAKFRHAKEMRGRENSRGARGRESVKLGKDEIVGAIFRDKEERLEHERLQRGKFEEDRECRRHEKEKEMEEYEREQRRIERERARQAVDRATMEARERAAADARLRAEKAAATKALAEARERAERVAVQRAQAEARERAAREAKERAERAAAEARNRESGDKAAEERTRAERAAMERAAAEARKRDTKDARENSATAAVKDPAFDGHFQNRQGHAVAKTPGTTSSNLKKAASTANVLDDLTSIFGAAASIGEFQEVEGETEERRRARLERHQRTQERAAKALAEKNERDLQAQWEQQERHRIADTLDMEIKRWAAGKEGNLRALLSTLQYVLWPECGWQPVSLTDLMTAAAVKKAYRKANVCIHPDKVQQKGANLQQKYIAEEVFHLLKEASDNFNSEELF